MTLGEKLKNETLSLIVLVYRANSSKAKVEIIQQAREQIELIRLLIRVLKDLKQITLKSFVRINKQVAAFTSGLPGGNRNNNGNFNNIGNNGNWWTVSIGKFLAKGTSCYRSTEDSQQAIEYISILMRPTGRGYQENLPNHLEFIPQGGSAFI